MDMLPIDILAQEPRDTYGESRRPETFSEFILMYLQDLILPLWALYTIAGLVVVYFAPSAIIQVLKAISWIIVRVRKYGLNNTDTERGRGSGV